MAGLVNDWAIDSNYSHGFLIVPLAVYLAWQRRGRLGAAIRRPSMLGLFVLAASLAVLVAGTLGAELFLQRIALIGALVGVLLFTFGREHVAILAFPVGFLLLMIPLPSIVFNQIAFPLQLLASRFGEFVLSTARIPVLREGNLIILSNTTLEVAEACSGIRSLFSLLTLGIVFGYFMEHRALTRVVLACATIPVAIAANGLRVAGTGIAAYHLGAEAANGFRHAFSGWLVFLVSLAMLMVVQRCLAVLSPTRGAPAESSTPLTLREDEAP